MSQLFEVENTPEVTVENHERAYQPKSKTALALMDDPKVIDTAEKVDMSDTVALYDLGKEPAEEMSKISSSLLGQLTVADTIGSTKTLDALSKIAKQIEFKELKPSDYKGLKGLFQKVEDVVNKRIAKYSTIGGEVTDLYTSLKEYENTIQKRIDDMDKLAKSNEVYAKNLDQYIALIYILRNNQKMLVDNTRIKAQSGDEDAQIELPKLEQAAEVLDKRAFDLEQAKTMATVTAPQIKQTQDNNLNLIQQYHSAFINTIPALNTALVQAVTALQQNYAQQGINANKEATAALMKSNAERLAINNKFIAESSGKGLLSTEDMQGIVDTILKSVEETKSIEANNAKQREESRQKMTQIVDDFKKATLEEQK